MRAFGIFAAFAAITSVFAAPVPAPANAVKARDNTATVSVDISDAVSTLQDAVVNHIVPQIANIKATATDAQDLATKVGPVLTDLASALVTAAVKVVGSGVENALDIGDNTQSAGSLTIQEITQILSQIQQLISSNLCDIVAIVNDIDPALGGIVSDVLTALVWLLQGIQTVLGDLSLIPLSSLVGSVLSGFNLSIPGLN